jgi:membrane protein
LHDALLAAPAMAFHFFLSLLPLLVFVGYVVGIIARKHGVDAVLSPLLDNLPASAEAIVKKEVERLAGGNGTTLGPVAAASFLWLASAGVHGLMNAVENVVGAPRQTWWKKRALSLVWVIATPAFLVLTSLALLRWDAVMHPAPPRTTASSGSHTARTPVARTIANEGTTSEPPRRRSARIVRSASEHAFAFGLSLASGTALLAAFYRVAVRYARRVRRRVLPGAALAALLWMAMSSAFGLYVRTLGEYAVFYGSLAAVAVLLLWLWLSSLAILVGAEFNAQLEGHRD